MSLNTPIPPKTRKINNQISISLYTENLSLRVPCSAPSFSFAIPAPISDNRNRIESFRYPSSSEITKYRRYINSDFSSHLYKCRFIGYYRQSIYPPIKLLSKLKQQKLSLEPIDENTIRPNISTNQVEIQITLFFCNHP